MIVHFSDTMKSDFVFVKSAKKKKKKFVGSISIFSKLLDFSPTTTSKALEFSHIYSGIFFPLGEPTAK